jgi:2,3-bisphosphoglycerate-dependent phosphoglycerate mutase
MPQLVLLRHGESIWNRADRFTGWTDVDLSETGVLEAHDAARRLREGGYDFDLCFTSLLKRAIRTLNIVLDDLDLAWLPVSKHWRLNERHYGALQGRNKAEMAASVGEEQVRRWRRSYDERPPPVDESDPRFPGHDRRYADLSPTELPRTESLKDTVERTLPYWHDRIAPALAAGRRVLIVAHGNSLRGLVKYLDGMSDQDVAALEIPTGRPLAYGLDSRLVPVDRRYL